MVVDPLELAPGPSHGRRAPEIRRAERDVRLAAGVAMRRVVVDILAGMQPQVVGEPHRGIEPIVPQRGPSPFGLIVVEPGIQHDALVPGAPAVDSVLAGEERPELVPARDESEDRVELGRDRLVARAEPPRVAIIVHRHLAEVILPVLRQPPGGVLQPFIRCGGLHGEFPGVRQQEICVQPQHAGMAALQF